MFQSFLVIGLNSYQPPSLAEQVFSLALSAVKIFLKNPLEPFVSFSIVSRQKYLYYGIFYCSNASTLARNMEYLLTNIQISLIKHMF